MDTFSSMLDVGMKAMIIGTRLPENSHLIGRVVTVESLNSKGEVLSSQFTTKERTAGSQLIAVVSGLNLTESDMVDGYNSINADYLMPLPPLNETEQQKEQELSLCH